MAKRRRTKNQKRRAQAKPVNTQFQISFSPSSTKTKIEKKPKNTEQFKDLGSIKKDLFRSLIIASLILASIVMLYWFS